MENILSRKGLAISSAVAIAASSLIFAPTAYAAGGLKLEVSSGTIASVPIEQDITLKTSVVPGSGAAAADLATLKYMITSGGNVSVYASNGKTAAAATSDTAASAVATTKSADSYAADSYAAGDTLNFIELNVYSSGTTAYAEDASTVTLTVQAYADADGDGAIDAGEWASEAVTVKFMDIDDISLTTVLTQPALGDTTVEAVVTSTNINLDQSAITMDFSSTGTGAGASSITVSSGTYDATANDLTFATTAVADTDDDTTKVPADTNGTDLVVEAGTFKAQAQVSSTNVGNASTRAVATSTVATVTAAAAAGADNEALSSNDIDARSGSGSLKLTYTVKNGANPAVALEDEVVTLTLKENAINSLASAASVSVGGKTLSNTSAATVQFVTVTGTTDEDGEVSFVVSWTGAVKTNVLSVEATVAGKTSGVDTITFEDAAATTLQNLDLTGQTTGELYVVKNTAFSLRYSLLDQFGKLFTEANHSVQVTDGTVTATGVFSGGYATVNFAGFATPAAKTLLGDAFKSGASAGATDWDIELTVLAAANNAVSKVTITATDGAGTAASPKALRLKTWNDADTRIGEVAPADFTVAGTGALTTKAELTDVNGNVTRGPITYSGEGLLFLDADAQVWKAGSITVQSSTDGAANVEIFSNKAGAHTLTVTSGGVSATKTFYFATAKDDTGAVITASAPAQAAPGSSFKVTIALKDKYGNAVTTDSNATGFNDGTTAPTFSIRWDGPGIVAGTMPTSTNSNGEASFYVLLGSNDKGAGTVTATYDADGTGTAAAAISASATVNSAAVASAGTVNVGSFNGKLVVYAKNLDGKRISWKVGGNWGKAVAVGNTLNRFDRPTPRKGVTVSVEIYVDGVKTLTKSVVTR
jgi:hypothetical protein